MFGHSGSQAPQLIQSSVILIAIFLFATKLTNIFVWKNYNLNLNQRISLFAKLGSLFKDYEDNNLNGKTKKLFNEAIENSIAHNSFFTKKNINKSLSTWAKNLTKKSINNFISNYSLKENIIPKKVAIIMAGNIPLVGFHDFLCVILSGNIAVIKLSSKDYHLFNYILDYLTSESHNFSNHFEVCNEKLNEFDAVIATGNNISADQFDLYFKSYPRIIRRNRHSIAVLEGDESNSDLELLANDIFYYYGLGCRNVSKIFIPSKYNLDKLFKSFMSWKEVINKNSYANNYDYYRAIYLLNKENFYDNGFVLLKESNKIGSPVGTIYFEYYDCLEDVFKIIENNSEKIQCVVSKTKGVNKTYFGQTQEPKIDDYADNVDTFDFLLKLNWFSPIFFEVFFVILPF